MDKLNFNNGKPCKLSVLLVNDIPTGLKADVATAKTGLLEYLQNIGIPTQVGFFEIINKPCGVFNKKVKNEIIKQIPD